MDRRSIVNRIDRLVDFFREHPLAYPRPIHCVRARARSWVAFNAAKVPFAQLKGGDV
jgi:hypothetical protein